MEPVSLKPTSNSPSPAVSSPPTDGDQIARRKAIFTCCKKATKFVFSTVGLAIIVALYSVAGAYIFQLLEQTNEKEECIQACSHNSSSFLMAGSCFWHLFYSCIIHVQNHDDNTHELKSGVFLTLFCIHHFRNES